MWVTLSPVTPANFSFFSKPADLRKWFRANHAKADELWVGYYKKDSGRPSVTWPESVDEALCVGWIDGIRKRLDEHSYVIRFTPRRPGSIWSTVNVKRVAELTKARRMHTAGLNAFAARRANKSGIYAYEQRRPQLEQPYAALMKKNAAALEFFERQSPYYRKTMSWFIMSAKKEETRMARLKKLMDACAKGKKLL
jgi:uncharacterized protein YdeI (YjbR/CyaY-like superfamily)